MKRIKKVLGIILHSGSYDRLYNGLSIGLAALALGRDVRLFFSYSALGYLKSKGSKDYKFDSDDEIYKDVLKKNIEKGHILKVSELLKQIKAMDGKIYSCTNSMGILNIARNELVKEVDKSMGLTTFLSETASGQLLFI